VILIEFKWSNVYSWLKQALKSSKHVLKLTLKVLKRCCFTFNSNSIIIKVTKQLYESIAVLFSQNLSKFKLFSPKEFFSQSSKMDKHFCIHRFLITLKNSSVTDVRNYGSFITLLFQKPVVTDILPVVTDISIMDP